MCDLDLKLVYGVMAAVNDLVARYITKCSKEFPPRTSKSQFIMTHRRRPSSGLVSQQGMNVWQSIKAPRFSKLQLLFIITKLRLTDKKRNCSMSSWT